ncbi:MAG: MBL fold metallo-hydrolase [Eubacteriales bacterium]|nr:MBL fold metallo-hydrolase [Eubacteriales bacterium]
MKLTWYGHSCFGLYSADGSVIFDPYSPASVPGISLPELTADAVICSHFHGDHGYEQGVKLTGEKPRFSVTRLDTFHDGVRGALRGKNTVSAVDAEKMRIVHMGDIGHMLSSKQLEKLGSVDVLMIPVGGHYTVDARTAREIVDALKPRIVIPMHYRGEGFGYDVISTADEFVSLSENVRYYDTNELEISPDTPKITAVLKCPVR